MIPILLSSTYTGQLSVGIELVLLINDCGKYCIVRERS